MKTALLSYWHNRIFACCTDDDALVTLPNNEYINASHIQVCYGVFYKFILYFVKLINYFD